MAEVGQHQPSGETLRFMQRLWLAHALDVRSKAPGCSAGDIADTLNIHRSTVTGILARLVERGLIRRTTDPDDRRRARLELTPRGREIDREKRGTVEGAVRWALGRTNDRKITAVEEVLIALVEELMRDEVASP